MARFLRGIRDSYPRGRQLTHPGRRLANQRFMSKVIQIDFFTFHNCYQKIVFIFMVDIRLIKYIVWCCLSFRHDRILIALTSNMYS